MDWGIDPADLTPAATLERCVDLAIDRRVAAVLLPGDVVDSNNARFEAMVPLETCTRRLLDAGIEVIAMAGNHDVEALPRMASMVDGFRLLGSGGTWQAHVVSHHGAAGPRSSAGPSAPAKSARVRWRTCSDILLRERTRTFHGLDCSTPILALREAPMLR